ncbi:MAG TPA: hydroxysqualene dehydroxylase HpnE [Acidobacteriaceae bacterium]|nr:hydroxysqualene dehydroxylase HpnE [Acidobacteriaceae bacterium]
MSERIGEDVVIVGAGAAGLAAAVALSGAGARVTLVERKPYVGGRAYSYLHPALDEVIDSQHVLLGCCTNLIDLCRLAGADKHIRWYDEIPFLEPGTDGAAARRTVLKPGWLPSPGHFASSFQRAPMLKMRDKMGIARGLTLFLRGIPADDREAFSEWVRRTGQTERAIRHFWEPVVVSTLNDVFERCSTRSAAQVFCESFLRSAEGGRFGIPTQPLSEFYAAVAQKAESQETKVRLRSSVECIERTPDGEWSATASDGTRYIAPTLLLALPFEQAGKLLATIRDPTAAQREVIESLERFVHAPITTIHLWLDREVTELDHAALLDTRIQWMFNKTRIRRREPGTTANGRQYLELVISASFDELRKDREQILVDAREELARFFPEARAAKVVKAAVLKEAQATFSVTPGLDKFRPNPDIFDDGLFLAGDWTQSGWPSTMEGAIRSGRLAAEKIADATGDSRRFVTPDLPPRGFMRMLAR